MIRYRLFLSPPLGIARLGDSPNPLSAFEYAANDLSPEGTGKTTLEPATTFSVDEEGNLKEVPPDLRFRDEQGRIKPVAVFFELRYEEIESRKLKPVTPAVLAQWHVSPQQLHWSVHVANLKAFHYTRKPGSRIEALLPLDGDDTKPHTLEGRAPADAPNPLVPREKFIPLGTVQLTKPRNDQDCFRLYFKPAKGEVYGPTDLLERKYSENPKAPPDTLRLPLNNLILNPYSAWCRMPSPKGSSDLRTIPSGLFAQDKDNVSLGLIDDVCDGVVTCGISGGLVRGARARIFTGPPDAAPDRRHFCTLADGLKDREEDSLPNGQDPLLAPEVRDLLERVWETVGLMNVDFCNTDVPPMLNAFHAFVASRPFKLSAVGPLILREGDGVGELPLTHQAREMHRRLAFPESFEALLLQHPELLEHYMRPPDDPSPLFDHRMPALMRGPTGKALSLTRRQYHLLLTYARRFAGK